VNFENFGHTTKNNKNKPIWVLGLTIVRRHTEIHTQLPLCQVYKEVSGGTDRPQAATDWKRQELVLIPRPGKLNEDASNSILFYHSDAEGGVEKKYRNT